MGTPCHMPEPCANCPFRREGGVRLRRARIIDIHDKAGAFPCHKTVNRDQRDEKTERECAGALIFAYKAGVTNQLLRITERLGMVDRALAEGEHPEIFDSLEDMLETAEDGFRAQLRRSLEQSPADIPAALDRARKMLRTRAVRKAKS